MFYWLCNHCNKKIADQRWHERDYIDVVIMTRLGLRFHRHCWERMPKRERASIIRREWRQR